MIGGTEAPAWCGAERLPAPGRPPAKCYQPRGHKGAHRTADGRLFALTEPRPASVTLSPRARYIIGEAEHFAFMGTNPLHLAAALGMTIDSLGRVLMNWGRHDLAAWAARHDERIPA